MPFEFQKLEIPDVIFVKAQRFPDDRGFFQEMYKASAFVEHGIPAAFVQDNLSHSQQGVVRALHYQKAPHAQGKLVMVLHGRIYDVAVDIRRGSATFGQWVGRELTSEGGEMLWVPAGFAHGFCVLSPEADLLYKVTDEYAPDCERGIIWNDPSIGIKWPVDEPLLSKRDVTLPRLQDAEIDF